MPTRILRDWTDSEHINELSFQAESLFTRLIMKADDFGRFHAHAALVKAACFPLRLDSIRDADITRWIAECEKAGLIAVFEFKSRKYLQINNFKQRTRASESKFPAPPVYACGQGAGICPRDDGQGAGIARTETETETLFEDGGGDGRASAPPPTPSPLNHQSILAAINRATDYLSAEEQEIARDLVSEGCLIVDFESAFQATVARGKPVRSLKYLRNMVRDARDVRTKPKSPPKAKGSAHDLAGKEYGESQVPAGWLDENDSAG